MADGRMCQVAFDPVKDTWRCKAGVLSGNSGMQHVPRSSHVVNPGVVSPQRVHVPGDEEHTFYGGAVVIGTE